MLNRSFVAGVLAMSMALLVGCPGDEDGVQCASGIICPSGTRCAANQDMCIDDSCGDGALDTGAGEECDDGNVLDGDGCDNACILEAFCGDGATDPGEECDDGNSDDGDGCDSACAIEPYCGDDNVDPDEECDDGNNDDGDGCDSACIIEPFCGDDNLDPGEGCDDGNNDDGDGCDSACAIEPYCGDDNVDPGEECDDGNNDDGDGCSSDCFDENMACPAPVDRDQYTYVVSAMQLPQNASEAAMLALDIDFKLPLRADNVLGQVLASLAGQFAIDLNAMQQGAISRGDTIMLASLQTTDLGNSMCATVGMYLGENPGDPPCAGAGDTVCGGHLGGNTSFDVSAASPLGSTMDGAILGGGFAMNPTDPPGNVAIELQLSNSAPPTRLDLVGARTEFNMVMADGLQSGILGGAMTEADVQSQFLPGLHNFVAESIAADCTGGMPCCTPGSSGDLMVDLFDENLDCQVDLDEFRNNALITALVAPDLDLFDMSGVFAPGVDGVPDSVSIGVGVTAVGGLFAIP